MHTRRLGRTGLHVVPLCFGGNVFNWTIDEPTSFQVLDAFVEAGGDFVDTADVYSRWASGNKGGESETVLGNWMKERGNRHSIIVATKAGSPMGDHPNQKGLSRYHIMSAVEDSLRRLQTDYIDLYQSHQDDLHTPLEETLRAYDDLVKQGKVRYIGASNYSAWRLMKALSISERYGLSRYETLQPVYSLANRAPFERELEPLCEEEGVGVITYSSLASGFLSGKYRRDQPLPTSARASGIQQRYMNDKGFGILEVVSEVAEQHRATPSQVALAWILTRPSVSAPIASTTTVEQTREMMAALDLTLDPDELSRLDAISSWKER